MHPSFEHEVDRVTGAFSVCSIFANFRLNLFRMREKDQYYEDIFRKINGYDNIFGSSSTWSG